jgi:hypothetical protein
MRVETTTRTLYEFAELGDAAKERARDWFREGALDHEWYDYIYDDAKAVGALMGITVDTIHFSGFACQGDGACFVGSYEYSPGGIKAVRTYAPEDDTLLAVARALRDAKARGVQRQPDAVRRTNKYELSATVEHGDSNYCHESSVLIDVYHGVFDHADEDTSYEVTEALRDFMRWIYQNLEREYDYLLSDESVDANIRANEYEFTEDGRRA